MTGELSQVLRVETQPANVTDKIKQISTINMSDVGYITSRLPVLFVLSQFTVLSSPVLCFQGQCFVAINPENFAPGFSDRMSDLLSIQRGMDPVSRSYCCNVNIQTN